MVRTVKVDQFTQGVFGWSDLGRKERERKEIGRKWIYFHCLVGGKSWKEKDE